MHYDYDLIFGIQQGTMLKAKHLYNQVLKIKYFQKHYPVFKQFSQILTCSEFYHLCICDTCMYVCMCVCVCVCVCVCWCGCGQLSQFVQNSKSVKLFFFPVPPSPTFSPLVRYLLAFLYFMYSLQVYEVFNPTH